MNEAKIIILGTSAMLLPVMAIIIFVVFYNHRQRLQRETLDLLVKNHRQEMLEASVASQENVRRQIGGDLHDEIGTLLSATRMSLSQVVKYEDNPAKREFLINQTQELLNDTLNNVRKLSKELVPSTLDEFGLIIALKDFTEKMTEYTGIMVSFSHGELSEVFDKKVELAFYRTAQELVNNALKHAKASIIDIQLQIRKNDLVLQVSDNGIGFDLAEVNKPNRGIGIKNIESRISVIKGKIKFDIEKGKGASFEISIALT